MAQRLQELCAVLVEDAYGRLSSEIFVALADAGRLSRLELQQTTQIPARQLRHALTTLTQQHILLHCTSDDGVSRYQVDWRNTYYLIRSDRVTNLVEDRYGEGAAKIIAYLLQLGHARVNDLAQAFDFSSAPDRDNRVDECPNGMTKANGLDAHPEAKRHGRLATVGKFHSTLRNLLKAGFLIKLGNRTYLPAADLQHELEEVVISEQFPDRKVNGPKKKTEFKVAVNNLKRKWRDAEDYSDRRDLISVGNINRPAAKRVKINGVVNGISSHEGDNFDVEESVPKLPNDMVLKVNYAHCDLALRSQRLEQMAEPFLGGVTATVYGALLQVLESKLKVRDGDIEETHEDDDEEQWLPTATTVEVAEVLDPAIDLTLGIQGAAEIYKMSNGNENKAKRKIIDNEFADIGIKREIDSDEEDAYAVNGGHTSYRDRNKKLSLLEEHLNLLEEHQKNFCTRVGGAGRGEWRVHFPALTETLVQTEIDTTVLARHGKIHMRIVRMLRERGFLEEKQVAAFSVMRLKDIRAILTELQFAGIVESVEVPKDTGRQPSRATYLWSHNKSRVQSALLQQTYQAMARTMQRLRVERENYKGAIEKAEMMGVRQEALTQNEREAVMQWREVEERLLVQVQRMDEAVALFRDFSGKDLSLVS